MELSEIKMKILIDFFNQIIPESKEFNMPSGSFVINELIVNEDVRKDIDQLFKLVEMGTQDSVFIDSKILFSSLKSKNRRLFFNLCQHVIKAYYTNFIVLSKISKNSSPPFPAGNKVNDLDYSILETVFLMGCKYRKV
jgi:hypothetical protein